MFLALITLILSLTVLLLLASFKFGREFLVLTAPVSGAKNTLYGTSFNALNTFHLCIEYCGVS